jgi:hypothetical protein
MADQRAADASQPARRVPGMELLGYALAVVVGIFVVRAVRRPAGNGTRDVGPPPAPMPPTRDAPPGDARDRENAALVDGAIIGYHLARDHFERSAEDAQPDEGDALPNLDGDEAFEFDHIDLDDAYLDGGTETGDGSGEESDGAEEDEDLMLDMEWGDGSEDDW